MAPRPVYTGKSKTDARSQGNGGFERVGSFLATQISRIASISTDKIPTDKKKNATQRPSTAVSRAPTELSNSSTGPKEHIFVTISSRSQYMKVVMDQDKDVLVEYSTSSSEQGRQIMRKLRDLAEKYQKEGSDNSTIVIASVDVEKVEIPRCLHHRVNCVPCVTLYPARHKDKPSNFFESGADVNDYYKFVEENRGH